MIQIHKENLLTACKYLQRVVPRKPTLPALSGVRVEPSASEVRLIATNLEQAVHITIPSLGATSKIAALRAKKAGAFLVDSGVLANAAATADADTYLSIDKDRIQVQIEGQLSTIPTSMAEELYDIAKFTDGDWIPTAGQFDPDAVKRLLRFASRDEHRFVLQGVSWDKEGCLIATDGRRLLIEPFSALPPEIVEWGDVIIPAEAFALLPPRASISISRNHIAFVATEKILTIRIYSKRIEGKYPNWRQVVPQPSGNSARFNNEDAAAALRKINKISTMTETRISVSLGRITFESHKDGRPGGSFTQGALVTGAPTGTNLNTKFLIDALESGGDTLDYKDEMSPIVITGVKANKQILMPMRTGSASAPQHTPEPEEVEA